MGMAKPFARTAISLEISLSTLANRLYLGTARRQTRTGSKLDHLRRGERRARASMRFL